MRGGIEIELYRAERATYRYAQRFLAADFLFPDCLPGDFSGKHQLIEAPAAAKESDAALEFADHVRRVADPIGKFQPG